MSDATDVGVSLDRTRPRLLLIGSGDHVTATIKLSQAIHRQAETSWQLVLLEAAVFPFRARPSTILVPGMPAGVIACVPSLEEFGVASRLASTAGLPGCHDGAVTELAALWLQSLEPEMLAQVHMVVSGEEHTVSAVEELGRRLKVPVRVVEGS